MVVLDTHALLWWSLDPDKLSPKARDVCDEMENSGGYISSISIWELGIKIKRGKLDLGATLADYVGRLKMLDWLKIVPVNEMIWMENLALTWEHTDPVDRTIVATAKLRDLPLVTNDEAIANFYPQTIW